jgi:hypothetical protein
MENSAEKANLYGMTIRYMRENLRRVKWMEEES